MPSWAVLPLTHGRAVTSTYCLMIKFPTENRVGEVRGNQVMVCKCYVAMLEMDDHLHTICLEEQWTVAEPVEGLEEALSLAYQSIRCS